MADNDKRNAIKKLQSACKSVKYTNTLDTNDLAIGSPKEHLKILHYLFLDYSPVIAKEIVDKHSLELSSKNDKLFVDGIYKLARDMLNCVPKLTKEQFFQTNFTVAKCKLTSDLIECVQKKLKKLQPANAAASTTVIAVKSSITTTNTAANKENIANLDNNESISPRQPPQPTNPIRKHNSFKTPLLVQNHLVTNTNSSKPVPIKNNLKSTLISTNLKDTEQLSTCSSISNSDSASNTDGPQAKINELIEKNESLTDYIAILVSRMDGMEKMIQSQNEIVTNFRTTVDTMSTKMTLLENEILILKQVSYKYRNSQNSNNNTLNNDNDMTSYETPLNSFLHGNDLNDSLANQTISGNIRLSGTGVRLNSKTIPTNTMAQGIACDVEQISENFDDLSLNSNDSTPTSLPHNKMSRLFDMVPNSTEKNINRAKELVFRASHLNEILSEQLKV